MGFKITPECAAQCMYVSVHMSCMQCAGLCLSFTEEQEALELFHYRLFH